MPRHASGPLDRVEITSPCSADWDSMTGNERVRFCEHCRLNVQDVSAMTPTEAYNLVLRSSGRLCLRIHRRPDGSVVTRPAPATLYQLRRRVSRVAAGAFGAALSLSAAAAAHARPPASQPTAEASASAARDGQAGGQDKWNVTLSGVALSPDGSALPAAFVTVNNERTGLRRGALTDATGSYNIEGLEAGTYTIWISKPGFGSQQTQGVSLSAGVERRVDVVAEGVEEIEVRETVTTGVVSIVVEITEPLVKAVAANDLGEVKRLLGDGADANAVDKAVGISALGQAVANGNREIAVELLRAGAEVDARLEYRQTALMKLTPNSTEEVVRELLFAGAKVDLRDEGRNTALMIAAGSGPPGVVELLLRAGARVNARNEERWTALMHAASVGSAEKVRALVSAGADLDAHNRSGWTALRLARENGHDETADLLLALGAADAPPPTQEPPAEAAAQP